MIVNQNEIEDIVMGKLLDGEDELFISLKKQYANAKVTSREITGCGFFTKFEVADGMQYQNVSGKIDDVKAVSIDGDEEYLFFILYVEAGKIDTLECFTTLDEWDNDYSKVKVEYCYPDKRKYAIE